MLLYLEVSQGHSRVAFEIASQAVPLAFVGHDSNLRPVSICYWFKEFLPSALADPKSSKTVRLSQPLPGPAFGLLRLCLSFQVCRYQQYQRHHFFRQPQAKTSQTALLDLLRFLKSDHRLAYKRSFLSFKNISASLPRKRWGN